MICTECHTECGELSHYAHEGPVCWDCYVAINDTAEKLGPAPDQIPGYAHALGCPFNGLPAIACACGMPNAAN